MTAFISIAIAIVVLLALYALWLRPWLKKQPWTQSFFAWIEPAERALFKKSETILMGRLLWVGSLFVSLHDAVAVFASNLDMTPLTTRIMDLLHISPDLRPLTVSSFIALIGFAINKLRATVTKPLDQVAAPENKG